ncbi:MAG: hypothetical protein IPP49_14215 [Saprospiraceae bacterium]|nr:hypothetical protein [Saprospiraceae bacterium]
MTKKDFEIYNQNMEKVVEPGEFHVFVGGNSDTQNKVSVTLQ